MALRLEDIRNGARIEGIVAKSSVEIVLTEWIGDQALNIGYRTADGALSQSTLTPFLSYSGQ